MKQSATYTISRLAQAADVHVETVRYYQRRGLLPAPEKAAGSIRRYSEDEVQRLRFIKRAQGIGFSLDEASLLLRMRDNVSCGQARALAEAKILEIEDRIETLERLRDELAACVRECGTNRDDGACPVIERLDSPTF